MTWFLAYNRAPSPLVVDSLGRVADGHEFTYASTDEPMTQIAVAVGALVPVPITFDPAVATAPPVDAEALAAAREVLVRNGGAWTPPPATPWSPDWPALVAEVDRLRNAAPGDGGDGGVELAAHIADATGAHPAPAISFNPGGLAAPFAPADSVDAMLRLLAAASGGGTPGAGGGSTVHLIDRDMEFNLGDEAARLEAKVGDLILIYSPDGSYDPELLAVAAVETGESGPVYQFVDAAPKAGFAQVRVHWSPVWQSPESVALAPDSRAAVGDLFVVSGEVGPPTLLQLVELVRVGPDDPPETEDVAVFDDVLTYGGGGGGGLPLWATGSGELQKFEDVDGVVDVVSTMTRLGNLGSLDVTIHATLTPGDSFRVWFDSIDFPMDSPFPDNDPSSFGLWGLDKEWPRTGWATVTTAPEDELWAQVPDPAAAFPISVTSAIEDDPDPLDPAEPSRGRMLTFYAPPGKLAGFGITEGVATRVALHMTWLVPEPQPPFVG